jgi:hypothetical protein
LGRAVARVVIRETGVSDAVADDDLCAAVTGFAQQAVCEVINPRRDGGGAVDAFVGLRAVAGVVVRGRCSWRAQRWAAS